MDRNGAIQSPRSQTGGRRSKGPNHRAPTARNGRLLDGADSRVRHHLAAGRQPGTQARSAKKSWQSGYSCAPITYLHIPSILTFSISLLLVSACLSTIEQSISALKSFVQEIELQVQRIWAVGLDYWGAAITKLPRFFSTPSQDDRCSGDLDSIFADRDADLCAVGLASC